MSDVVWRASGAAFDAPAFLRAFPQLEVDASFEHGFNLCLLEDVESGEVSAQLAEVLDRRAALFRAALHAGAESQLDVSLLVGGDERFTMSVALAPQVLRAMADLSLELRVSAYPTSD